MKTKILILSVITLIFISCIYSIKQVKVNYKKLPNLFVNVLGKSENEVNEKIKHAFNQLFYGDNESQRIFYTVGNDMAYIEDILHKDVRTEGMSYGMMIALQLNKKDEFDRLWKWAKTFMQHKSGQRENYFAWHCKTNGEMIDSNSASDGEEWFVTALIFASKRWGDGEGIYNYSNEARKILHAMLNKVENSDSRKVVTNMFNKKEKKVVFVPSGEADDFTDPSYHLPHFYKVWSWFDKENSSFWKDAVDTSRAYLKRAVHPLTSLSPDYSKFDGSPLSIWGGTQNNFQYDAWRVAMNVAVDYGWFQEDEWAIKFSDNLLKFFYSQGIKKYSSLYTLDGKPLNKDHNTGLVAMNAVAAISSSLNIKKDFLNELWEVEIPSGQYRYYDGVLYMLALLQLSGNFNIYWN
ncbi:MAG: glycosyl hydrolase family 8 [Melioribacteraceae bacterium]|nr:glycosyl hydrolase family 8 [Melioribacteraceae bacterium]